MHCKNLQGQARGVHSRSTWTTRDLARADTMRILRRARKGKAASLAVEVHGPDKADVIVGGEWSIAARVVAAGLAVDLAPLARCHDLDCHAVRPTAEVLIEAGLDEITIARAIEAARRGVAR